MAKVPPGRSGTGGKTRPDFLHPARPAKTNTPHGSGSRDHAAEAVTVITTNLLAGVLLFSATLSIGTSTLASGK